MAEHELTEIDAALRSLHGGPEAAQLSRLHERAAGLAEATNARRFHLTHAWIFALVVGDKTTVEKLEQTLHELGGL